MTRPVVIAHRGEAARHPENTLQALAAAVHAGATCLEFDLQLTGDGEVVLLHDVSLLRTAGVDADIGDLTLDEARRFSVGETARFGDHHGEVELPTLAQTVAELQRWPHVTAFVEIKHHSTDRFGIEHVTRKVIEILAPIRERCVLISFCADVLRAARRMSATRIGWCFEGFDAGNRHTAATLEPEVLLTDWTLLPDDGLWTGRWQWGLWEVLDPTQAMELYARGATWVETMAPTDMLADRRLRAREADIAAKAHAAPATRRGRGKWSRPATASGDERGAGAERTAPEPMPGAAGNARRSRPALARSVRRRR